MAGVTYILKLRDQMSTVARRAQSSLNRTTAAAQRTADSFDLIGIAAAALAIGGLFKMGAELEQTRLLFNTLSGSVEKGTKLFENLTQFANTTPFSNQALNNNARTLLAFGADAEEVEKNLRMLGDVAAGDSERLGRLTLAFAQSRSAARLMGQDLLQFINAGFNPLQIISEQTGISMLKLKKQMEKGLISFDLVEKAFESATAEGGRFHGLTNTMSKTMAGKWSTALGKAKFLIAELGLSMKDIFVPFIDGIIKAVDFLSKHRDAVFPVIKAMTLFVGTLVGIVAVMKIWIGVQKILNVLLVANPIGLVIAAVAALVTAIVLLSRKSETFRRVMFGVWEVVKLLGNTVWSVITQIFAPFVEAFRTIAKDAKEAGTALDRDFFKVLKENNKTMRIFLNLLDQINPVKGARNLGGGIGNLIAARNARKSGNELQAKAFRKMAGDFFLGKQKGTPSDIVTNIVDAFKKGAEKGAAAIDPFKIGTVVPEIADFGFDDELKKLQAEGVVSGNIKTFNINIGTLTGVNTLTTTNIEEGAEGTGRAFQDTLLKALADIANI